MSVWLIRNENGKYVRESNPYATNPKRSSFTSNVREARKFPTREAAQADCCGNEWPVSLAHEIGGF